MRLYREESRIISPVPAWVLIDGPYLYVHSSLCGLLWQVVTEWRHDKHLVG